MNWGARLLIAGTILAIGGPIPAGWADEIGDVRNEPLRQSDRVAQLKKDPETDPGGLPGRMDERPRTRGIAPSAPQRASPKDQDGQKSKSAPATPEADSAKPDKSEKRQ